MDFSLSKQVCRVNGVVYEYWRVQYYNTVGRRVSKRVGRANGKHAISKSKARERAIKMLAEMMTRPSRRSGETGASAVVTLERFRADYFATRPRLNPSTRAGIEHTFTLLERFFGKDKRLDQITRDDALRWESSLVKTRRKQGGKTVEVERSGATVRRHVRTAKALFGERKHGAVGRGFIGHNPFALLDSGAVSGGIHYVPEADVEKILEELGHWSLRNAVALARYCGLRCPSEVTGLVWDDIAWDRHRFTVHDVKRSRQETGSRRERTVLLDPRAQKWLLKGYAACPDRIKQVCPRLPHKANLARTVADAAARAGVPKWPKLFQSLRQSAENDWAARYPQHVVSSWLGHSMKVSERHYLAIGDECYSPEYGAKLSQKLSQTPQKADGAGV